MTTEKAKTTNAELSNCGNTFSQAKISPASLTLEIRLGIAIADEKAKRESMKMKMEAPLTIEEEILLED